LSLTLGRLGVDPDGPVAGGDFISLMEGRHPGTGRFLRPEGAGGGRGGGIDVTFSAPKSVSTVWALAEPWRRQEIEAAHATAVEQTVRYMREHVQVVRRRHSGQVVEEPAKDLIAAEYQHTTARGVAGGQAPDPQLHSHVVITGVVREDDRLVATWSRPVFRSARELGAHYRAALAHELAERGYEITRATGKDGKYFELAGVPEKLREAFSGRSREVARAAERFRARTGREPKRGELRDLALENRRAKALTTRSDLERVWRQAGSEHAFGPWEALQLLAVPDGRDVGEHARSRAISEVAERLAGPPTPEQAAALRAITGDERLAVLVGPAGTGKGVVIDMAARAERHAGHHTLGVAVSGSTAGRLGEITPSLEGRTSTIDALTTRAEAGTAKIGRNTTVFLDEAGMADHRRLDALTRLIDESGAKRIAVGDGKQLPSIGPGGMFDRLTAHARSAELADIHRTSDPAERQAWVALRRGEPEKAMAHYQAEGQLCFMDDRQRAGEAAVQRWAKLAKKRPIRSVALIADSSNVEIDRLNARAQHLRAERGELGHQEIQLPHRHHGLREGDLITFTAQHRQPGHPRVENGTRAEVTKVGESNNLTLKLDGSGREPQLAGKDLENVRLAYARHVYCQQGATADRSVVLTGGWQTSKESAYVQATRDDRQRGLRPPARAGLDYRGLGPSRPAPQRQDRPPQALHQAEDRSSTARRRGRAASAIAAPFVTHGDSPPRLFGDARGQYHPFAGLFFDAGGGIRTPKGLSPPAPKAGVSASSTTPARHPRPAPGVGAVHGAAGDCKVIVTMSSTSSARTGLVVTHPNRDKPVVQATRTTVIVLLVVSAALVLTITVGGLQAMEGFQPVAIQSGYVLIYLVLAFYAARWNRGVLPISAALAVLLAIFALVAAPAWFLRDKADYAQPNLDAGLLGLLTLLVIPLQILLVVFAMRGFSQGWNVELEVRDPHADTGGYGDVAPHPA
jgi:conjugative relaxase-like TrwC/TraI family protein